MNNQRNTPSAPFNETQNWEQPTLPQVDPQHTLPLIDDGQATPSPTGEPTPAQPVSSKRPAKHRGKVWVTATSIILALFTTFVLLDTFAIERVEGAVQQADTSSITAAQNGQTSTSGNSTAGSSSSSASSDSSSSSKKSRAGKGPGSRSKSSSSSSSSTSKQAVAGTASASSGTVVGTYSDENMDITVSKVTAYDTDIYIADIQVSSAEYLKTALAQNSYGRNLKDSTSNMAEEAGAVLAINGDYYGFRDDGYVLRNGVLYRETAAENTDALVIYGDGTMASVNQSSTSASSLKSSGAWQVLSFGPTLLADGQVLVDENDEVSQSMGSNPRTAIGMIEPLHYLVVVSDGRTDDNAGLSLAQLAQVFADNGATYAYNLDGGGSTTMYFQGEVINDPTSGNRDGERSVSDIVYFG